MKYLQTLLLKKCFISVSGVCVSDWALFESAKWRGWALSPYWDRESCSNCWVNLPRNKAYLVWWSRLSLFYDVSIVFMYYFCITPKLSLCYAQYKECVVLIVSWNCKYSVLVAFCESRLSLIRQEETGQRVWHILWVAWRHIIHCRYCYGFKSIHTVFQNLDCH